MVERFSESAAPSADDAGKAIVATMLLDPDAAQRAVEVLRTDDFLAAADKGDEMAGVFTAIKSLLEKGKRPAAVTVANEMKRLGVVPRKGDGTPYEMAPFLAELSRSYAVGVQMEEYCKILHTYGTRRRLRMAGLKLMELSQQDRWEDAIEYVGRAESILSDATAAAQTGGEVKRMGDVILRQLEIHKSLKPGTFTGIKTGFQDLDFILRGLQPADQIIIAARPSMGKTALAQNIGEYVAKNGGSVYMVSAEMPAELLALRAIASEGGVNSGMMRSGLIPASQYEAAEEALRSKGLIGARYFVDDESATVPQIRATAHRIRREGGLDLIIVDYLQHLNGVGPAAKHGNKVQEVGEISKGLKQLAKELRIPIITLAQLSRSVESRKEDDRRPLLSDLRDSGNIEQDADVVLMLYRENYYKPDCGHNNTEVLIRKHRNGPLGTVELEFIPERTKFVSTEKRYGS